MAQFYKELKELRESRGILLDEISDRTKINIRYLAAIEAGDFEVIETPYLRLFLRAYAEEIGGDSERALSQLDSFMGTNNTPVIKKTIQPDPIPSNDSNQKENEGFKKSDQKLRQDLIKGGILLVIFIFIIVILKQIFNQESTATVQDGKVEIKTESQTISNIDLLKDFIEDQSNTLSLTNVNPPFFIKLITREELSFTFSIGQTDPMDGVLQRNYEYDLDAFVDSSDLLFNNTLGLSTFINGQEIQDITDYQYPLRLTIKPEPPTLVIQRFKPIQ